MAYIHNCIVLYNVAWVSNLEENVIKVAPNVTNIGLLKRSVFNIFFVVDKLTY